MSRTHFTVLSRRNLLGMLKAMDANPFNRGQLSDTITVDLLESPLPSEMHDGAKVVTTNRQFGFDPHTAIFSPEPDTEVVGMDRMEAAGEKGGVL